MVIRRFLFSLVCLLASSLFMYGQIAVKTNVAMDAVALPNLGVEAGLSKKLTLDIPFYYNPWKYSDNKMLKLVMVNIILLFLTRVWYNPNCVIGFVISSMVTFSVSI